MQSTFVQQAATTIDRLRILDQRRIVFGSRRYDYQFRPPLALEQVEAFERAYQITLPSPYRQFLTELGNGGPGPYYGISPLEREAPQLLHPFPATQAFELTDDDTDDADHAEIAGALPIAEYGCGIFMLLVVRGEAAGQVWVDARYEGGIKPILDPQGAPMTFDAWWLASMGAELERFERIAALMRAATPHEEIHRLLEPGVLQLTVDETMLSLMDQDPNARPRVYADKLWGAACGLVEEHYAGWLQHTRDLES
jgi:hypothetical protein